MKHLSRTLEGRGVSELDIANLAEAAEVPSQIR